MIKERVDIDVEKMENRICQNVKIIIANQANIMINLKTMSNRYLYKWKKNEIYLDKEEIYNNTKEYELKQDDEIIFHLQDESYFYFFEKNINNDNIFSSYNQENLTINNKSNFYMLELKKNEFLDYEVNVNNSNI